ncbi:MAG: Fic family protein [Brevinema sp.]
MNSDLLSIYDLKYTINNKLIQKITKAHYSLGRLVGEAKTIPNQDILMQTLPLQEAKESSEIENIITTTEQLYQIDEQNIDPATKEVKNYRRAIILGYNEVKKNGYINNNLLKQIQETICLNNAGFRSVSGTVLKNNVGEIIYTPPQNKNEIERLMRELESYMNNENDVNTLIKMALIHYQFESIHPFYDGNGRTGRIINILTLIKDHLLDAPILYLSRYIIKHKDRYYSLFQSTREINDCNPWIEFILDGVIETSESTIKLIQQIHELLHHTNQQLHKIKISKRRDLIDHIFINPITNRKNLGLALNISYITATKYLNQLNDLRLLQKSPYKGEYHYMNNHLFALLTEMK